MKFIKLCCKSGFEATNLWVCVFYDFDDDNHAVVAFAVDCFVDSKHHELVEFMVFAYVSTTHGNGRGRACLEKSGSIVVS